MMIKIIKIELNGKCNITSCQKPNSTTWIIIALKYYCASCAKRLNSDIFNKPAALDMFGHDLCTVVK
jgi:hypothetical protein